MSRMEPRIIKTEKEYKLALSEVEELVALDPDPGTCDSNRLELLSLLISKYEDENFPIPNPDPIEAIRFRMDQQGLSHRDLVPYLGSRSRVSEILSGKRPLTLSMIRALHAGLGIPADVLVKDPIQCIPEDLDIDWRKFPLAEMRKRGWISTDTKNLQDSAEDIVRAFLEPLGNSQAISALYRRTLTGRSARATDRYATLAWTARVTIRALDQPVIPSKRKLDLNFMKEVVQLSWSERGPRTAREFLQKNGIHLVVERHLPRTHIDGAAMLAPTGNPVIGLTLRHDRLDNFWFTLLHELAHVIFHLRDQTETFVDDMDVHTTNDMREQEADRHALEAAIPRSRWKRSKALRHQTPNAIQEFANSLRVHPAIVAGRLRFELRNYRLFSQLVGYHEVRQHFPEVKWH